VADQSRAGKGGYYSIIVTYIEHDSGCELARESERGVEPPCSSNFRPPGATDIGHGCSYVYGHLNTTKDVYF